MPNTVITALTRLSRDIADLVGRVTPHAVAIRITPTRHVSGILWRGELVLTDAKSLPGQVRYTIVTPLGETVLARHRPPPEAPAVSDGTESGIACLLLETPLPAEPILPCLTPPGPGALTVPIGTTFEGAPTMRLAAVHRLSRRRDGGVPWLVLDLPRTSIDHGGPVFDTDGALIGMASTGPNGQAFVVPYAALFQAADPGMTLPVLVPRSTPRTPRSEPSPAVVVVPPPPESNDRRRGWLGLSLQPATVPDALAARAGQNSGRMVVSVVTGGPADQAGLRLHDVVLAVAGQSTSGTNSLRAFLDGERIGTGVDVRFLRDGHVYSVSLTIGEQPGR